MKCKGYILCCSSDLSNLLFAGQDIVKNIFGQLACSYSLCPAMLLLVFELIRTNSDISVWVSTIPSLLAVEDKITHKFWNMNICVWCFTKCDTPWALCFGTCMKRLLMYIIPSGSEVTGNVPISIEIEA